MLVGVAAGISLQVDAVGVPRLGGGSHQRLAVVDVDALERRTVYKEEELGVDRIPVGLLGAEIQPKRLAVKAFRHGQVESKPVMIVRAVPVASLAERLIGGRSGVRLRGGEVKALLDPDPGNGQALDRCQAGKLICDDIDAFFGKIHIIASFHKFLILF